MCKKTLLPQPFVAILCLALPCHAQESGLTNATSATAPAVADSQSAAWNIHGEGTWVGDWHDGFPARYSGSQSLDNRSASDETVDLDLYLGTRLWRGAEFHLDGLYWQGFGFNHTLGVEAFPNAEAYKVGNRTGNIAPVRVFLRQTIGLGGDQEPVPDDSLHLGGQQDVSRITLTVGQISALDVFDQNSFAGDPTTQFLNWALVGNEAWDYPANSLGFMSGFTAELNQKNWALRYGFFQMPREANGMAEDPAYLRAWGMVTEFEQRFSFGDHAGKVRLLAFLNRARMGSLAEALEDPARPADIVDTRAYRLKYGFCLNAEFNLTTNIGLFTRLGWNDGQTESWAYADVSRSGSAGVSIQGDYWHRPGDTFGLAGVVNGISQVQQQYFAAGGLGILAGDGALSYNLEKTLETYYKFQIWKTFNATADYQYVINPAYNAARGPVSILSARLHFDF